jgi:hypothetical protein
MSRFFGGGISIDMLMRKTCAGCIYWIDLLEEGLERGLI